MDNLSDMFNRLSALEIDGEYSKRFSRHYLKPNGYNYLSLYVKYQKWWPELSRLQALLIYRPRNILSHTDLIDNAWAVPYSSKLSAIFHLHLSVKLQIYQNEVIEFHVKYICKSHDLVFISCWKHGPDMTKNRIFKTSDTYRQSNFCWKVFTSK